VIGYEGIGREGYEFLIEFWESDIDDDEFS
jgi:hypothetical protein